jgi:hypothetical protein
MKPQRPLVVTPASTRLHRNRGCWARAAATGTALAVSSLLMRRGRSRHVPLSRRSAAAIASRTCVAIAPGSLLISRCQVNAGWLPSECACRVNGILIMFPLACSIRVGGGVVVSAVDRWTADVRGGRSDQDGRGCDLREARGRQVNNRVCDAEATGAME